MSRKFFLLQHRCGGLAVKAICSAWAQIAFAEEPPPDFDKAVSNRILDIGLAQSLRQQLSSECYGFVEQNGGQVRGFTVNESFQLLRDGYPWARFDSTDNLMIAREEVLVGGPGQGCAFTPPGGLVNLVTRRAESITQPNGHIFFETDQFGTLSGRVEQILKVKALDLRISAKQQKYRNSARNTEEFSDVAANMDLHLSPSTTLRWDFQLNRTDANNGLLEPALFAKPRKISRNTNREQPWARNLSQSAGSLIALESYVENGGLLKVGMSNVRFSGSWHSFYLDPQPLGLPLLSDYVYPDQHYVFDAFQTSYHKVAESFGIKHNLRLAYTNINVEIPDELRPQQLLGPYTPGQVFPEVYALTATSKRTLKSSENRITLQDNMEWHDWVARLGLQYVRLTDDNGSEKQVIGTWLPVVSLTCSLNSRIQLLATHSRGVTGRQFSSITSSTPNIINGIGISDETELGLRYKSDRWELGLGMFNLTRPYQFEQQTVTVWRGEQHHRGWEGTLQWSTNDDLGHIVLTTQWIDAEVTNTNDPMLDSKKPPGLPDKRASIYADYRLSEGSPWTISLSAEAVSKRATFDDNAIFVSGYANWSAGLEWQGQGKYKNITSQLTIQNLDNRYAWEDAGGGYAYPLTQRTIGLSLRYGL